MSLVLTRRVGESIIIDNKIEVTITKLKKSFGSAEDGGHVRIMIHAPGIDVHRSEVWEQQNGRPFDGAYAKYPSDKKGNK